MSGLTVSTDLRNSSVKGSNPLHQFESYNCLFTLSCLTRQQQNSGKFDKSTIRNIVASSKGDWQNAGRRVTTEFGAFDYFIDDVSIITFCTLSRPTGNSFATKITFKVTEPYSMGLFLLTLQRGAILSGYKNHREAPFLLTIEYAGYINGKPVTTDQTQQLTRQIPFKFLSIRFTVNGSGSVYECEAVPYNEIAFRDSYSNVLKDVKLTGSTVDQILVSGENSLQKMLDRQFEKISEDNNINPIDRIKIEFPKDFTDPNSSSNQISTSSIFTGLNDAGTVEFPNSDSIFDELRQIYKTNTITISPDKNWNFRQNLKIQQIIEEVVIRSEYITKQLLNDNVILDNNGMVNWYRIEARVIDRDESPQLGRHVRDIIIRVVPYKVHMSTFTPPNIQPPGYQSLKNEVSREYNYIYTGKNTDIVNFEIKFDYAFFVSLPSDLGNRTGQQNRSQSGLAGGESPTRQTVTTTEFESQALEPELGTYPASSPDIQERTSGSSASDTYKTAQARTLEAMLVNTSDLIQIELEIIGDPYYLPQSGMGNQIVQPQGFNLLQDGSMNYQSGEVDILINFRTPIDIDLTTGLYKFAPTVDLYSGLYRVLQVEHRFNSNKFTQILRAIRRRNQLEGSQERNTFFKGN
jgi:hypothetical protein